MSEIKLPLYPFFKQLQAYDRQKQRKALGTDVYFQFLEVVGQGYGLQSKEELFWVCKMLWLKPYHDLEQFQKLFDAYFIQLATKSEVISPKPPPPPTIDTTVDKPPTPPPIGGEEPIDTTSPEEETEEEIEEVSQAKKSVALKFQNAAGNQARFLNTNLEQIEQEVFSKVFRLQGKYPSISPRNARQNIRSLRVEQANQEKKQLDLVATIDSVAKNGYLEEVVLKGGTITHNKISLFIDQGGSMVAFQYLAELLAVTIQNNNASKKNSVFYFRNTPISRLYFSKALSKSISLAQFRKQSNETILILSDAGAARGFYDARRIEATKKFLKAINRFPVTWLNPMPKNRWAGTSAEYIRNYVDMYEATDIAFIRAIKQLKKLSQ